MSQATAVSPQTLLDTAKATVQAYNDKDWNRARSLLAPDFVYEEIPTGRNLRGPEEAIQAWQGWARAFPDSRGTIRHAIVADNKVVLEVSWKGTHRGPLETPDGSLEPTGESIDVAACVILEIEGEKVKQERHYFDMASLFAQLGL